MYASYGDLGAQPEANKDIMNVLELANSQHRKHIITSTRVVCIDIYADWCGPCKQTAPEYALIASRYSQPGECAVVKYNLDKMEKNEKANIHGIPVFEFYVEGKKVGEIVGADLPQVEERLKVLLQSGNQPTVKDHGPIHNRNSIRQNRSQMPQMDQGGQPYGGNQRSEGYHQPYSGNSQQYSGYSQQYQ
jgi:thioredoxin 1